MSFIKVPFLCSKKGLEPLRASIKFSIYLLILSLLSSCISTKKNISKHQRPSLELSKKFDTHFSGLLIVDPITKDTLFSKNAQKYFTPASTTKIFTLYTALKLLPNNVPSLTYRYEGDTIFVAGTGDPSALHPYFQDSTALNFLKKQTVPIAMDFNNYPEPAFGPGWAWEDYDTYFSPERSSFPLYGNTVQISKAKSLQVIPALLRKQVSTKKSSKNRELRKNRFYVDTLLTDTIAIPFITSVDLTQSLLESLLAKKVSPVQMMPSGKRKTLFGIPTDSLYRRMMYESDNFIAEQLLILASSRLSDTLSSTSPRKHMLQHYLSDMKQVPRWVDGSGLSRYNLFSPESMVQVLHKLYTELPQKKLLTLFPAGGVSGTLKDSFSGGGTPYIYAKSGSLGNNYALCGYLITNSNRLLLFSFMNNHFRRASKDIRLDMEHFLKQVRDAY
ncbi:D-alanyl-D-alanine carboxypeptidase [Spongiimicrobium salis]|uniref:D-alanyl-D-alanine carboxypeptidase n=1 Tax=Spongiimicrobium salis TaxID=1667022 RepID=UPI00374C8EB2